MTRWEYRPGVYGWMMVMLDVAVLSASLASCLEPATSTEVETVPTPTGRTVIFELSFQCLELHCSSSGIIRSSSSASGPVTLASFR
jgi:hypothetical protein